MAGKRCLGKKRQLTLWIPRGSKILSKLLYLAPFPRQMCFCVLHRNSRWPPKMAGKQAHPFEKHVFGHVTSLIG